MKKYFSLIRLKQWIKNFFVFAPLLFSKHLFEIEYFYKAFIAFLSFCFVSSSVYVINDIIDREKDKLHPKKKLRPIASGQIGLLQAFLILFIFLVSSILTSLKLNYKIAIIIAFYFVLNFSYSFWLKNIVILDIMTISVGFILRVIAGGEAIDVKISNWLILSTFFISIFLAAMKRRSELALFENNDLLTRKVLSEYSTYFADLIGVISASALLISYALYTINENTIEYFGNDYIFYSNIFAAFGIFRFMYLSYKKSKGENATEVMLTDLPMMINLILYVLFIIFVVYYSRLIR